VDVMLVIFNTADYEKKLSFSIIIYTVTLTLANTHKNGPFLYILDQLLSTAEKEKIYHTRNIMIKAGQYLRYATELHILYLLLHILYKYLHYIILYYL
jgi:hypothetical protein